MSPETQSIAIHQALGNCIFDGTGKLERRGGTMSEFCVKCGEPRGYHDMPDYFSDLNAMHQVEKQLTPEQWQQYFDELIRLLDPQNWHDQYPKIVHATAAQRAEAFLRTLGVWKD